MNTTSTTQTAAPPQLVPGRPHRRLLVDGRAFLVLGGELHNSSASTPTAVRAAFSALPTRGLNTVLAPVSWSQIEPAEASFDFSLVDALLAEARRARMHLILLWFGAWKNGRSTYVPAWVRSDSQRFPRAATTTESRLEHLSPFAPAVREADAAAFSALMTHLRQADGAEHTVIMVQVENEVGLLGDSRDRSALATAHFHTQVPDDVFAALEAHPGMPIAAEWRRRGAGRSGTWPQVFGDSRTTDEAFMAAAYARHVDTVAAAGKHAFSLPMFANAWLYTQVELEPGTPAGGQAPGLYPSGGPVPRVAGLWRALAPSIDLVVPDLYFGDFDEVCRDYTDANDALLIPEMRRDAQGVGDAFVAVGTHGALGVSPFAIDTCTVPEAVALADAYTLLAAVAELLPDHPSVGIHLNGSAPSTELDAGQWRATVNLERPSGSQGVERGYGIVVQQAPDVLLLAGRGLEMRFTTRTGAPAELVQVDELDPEKPTDVLRILNGDETESGTALLLHALTAPEPGDGYQIPKGRRQTALLRVVLAAPPQPDPDAADDRALRSDR